MPAQRPRASFEPIAPDLDLDALIEETPNFQFVDRIPCEAIKEQGLDAFDKLVQLHVIKGGKPLVIDGYHSLLDPWTFSSKWLQDNHGDKVEVARDLRKDNLFTPLTLGHYLRSMSTLTEQFFETPDNYRQLDRQRVYLKDIDCPPVWFDKLREQLPSTLLYLNESTGDLAGPGSTDENAPTGGKRKGKGIAGAGDLMSSLPPAMRAENLMCYIGHEGTYTPAHREMCASLGQNIMVECSDVLGDEGKPERPGSSIWFMTESKDRHTVSEYWLSVLGHDIEVEKHFAQLAAWKKAPFTVYIVEQKAGDFILIPPLAPHQVWNRGTRTMKVAWNRTTVETLDLAFKEALASARLVCRDEQYKNKAIVYYSLQKYSALLAKAKDQEQTAPSPQEALALQKSPKIRQLRREFKKLFLLFKDILLSEMFSTESGTERNVQFVPFESNVTCSYCRGNIFNRFLTCTTCEYVLQTVEPEPYDVCMDCFVMGRSCGCISKFKWVEQFKWKELASKYEQWRRQYLEFDSSSDAPLPITEERQQHPQKTLAQICQEQLKRRPWIDLSKPQDNDEEELDSGNEEIIVNDDGTVRKPKKRRSEVWLKNHKACHVCAHRHEKWRMVECSCGKWWCFGSLFRGHDQMPKQILEDPNWKCPHCHGICNAGMCRKDTRQTPYEPKGTLLGHDTKKVADARSVESLVDFSVSNLNWIREPVDTPATNSRLTKKQQEAERAKENDIVVGDQEHSDAEDQIEYSPAAPSGLENSLIDPSLLGDHGASHQTTSRPSNGTVVPVSTLLNHESDNDDDDDDDDDEDNAPAPGYHAAAQSGPAGPFQTRPLSLDGGNDEADDSLLSNGSKRRVNLKDTTSSKKRRLEDVTTEDKNVSGATRQYLKEKERHALEVARKKGRFILTQAALRGRSKLVKLPLGPAAMARVIAGQAYGHRPDTKNDLLRSDVQVQKPPPPTLQQSPTNEEGKSKPVRIRVEKDEDFMTSRKRGKATQPAVPGVPSKKKYTATYEEVELDLDSDSHVEGNVFYPAEETLEDTAADRKRRVSKWQSKHTEDGPDVPYHELPENYRDKGRSRGRPSKNTDVAASVNDDGSSEVANGANTNADWPDDDDNADEDSMMGVKAVASISGSILSRPASKGKKIRIVSGRNKK